LKIVLKEKQQNNMKMKIKKQTKERKQFLKKTNNEESKK